MADKARASRLTSRHYRTARQRDLWQHSRRDWPLTPALGGFRNCIGPNAVPERPLTQRMLDEAASRKRFDALLTGANRVERPLRLAAAEIGSGTWLTAPPVQNLGLLLPDEAVSLGVALRVGAAICQPHRCRRYSGPPPTDLLPRQWPLTPTNGPQRCHSTRTGDGRRAGHTRTTRTVSWRRSPP